MSHPRRALAGLLALASIAGCERLGCGERPTGRLPELAVTEAPSPGLRPQAGPELAGSHLDVAETERGEPAVVARALNGRIVYYERQGHGWLEEEVAPGALPGPLSMTRSQPGGEVVVAAIHAPEPEKGALVGPPPEAPKHAVAGEGILRLHRRRAPKTWRSTELVARALFPDVEVGPDEAVHLVCLQPRTGTDYQVVYVRTDGIATVREEVGVSARAVAPVLRLRNGQPVVAHLDGDGHPVISSANERSVFQSVPVPSELLGTPAGNVEALALSIDGGAPRLAWVREVTSPATLSGLTHPPRPDRRLVGISELLDESPRSRALGWAPARGRVELSIDGTGDRVLVVAGGAAGLMEAPFFGAPGSPPPVLEAKAPVAGAVIGAGLSDASVVTLTGERLWVTRRNAVANPPAGG